MAKTESEGETFTVSVPQGVKASVHGRRITMEGPKGRIEKEFDDPRFNEFIALTEKDGNIVIAFGGDKRKTKAMAGTIRAHAKNMAAGVAKGYTYKLKIVYTHFPITVAQEKGKIHVKNFLGEKGSRTASVVGESKVAIDKEHIVVTGANLEAVSQTAANIERACKLRGRDRRIFQDGIYITKKE